MDIFDEKKQRHLCRTNASRASLTPLGAKLMHENLDKSIKYLYQALYFINIEYFCPRHCLGL